MHTPIPWINAKAIHHDSDYHYVEGQNGEWIADIIGSDAEPNAEFIVRAVNSHQALVEALEGMMTWKPSGFAVKPKADAIAKAQAALKLAKA